MDSFRVTRTFASQWSIYTSVLPSTDGTGAVATDVPSKQNTPIFQGSVFDDEFTLFSNGYFGVSASHGDSEESRTAAEFDQFYFDTDSDASLPVTLQSLNGIFSENFIELSWRTESEIDNIGFLILRAEEKEGIYAEISEMISGAGSSTQMLEYSYVDNTVQKDQTYWYKLVQVDISGAKSIYGPIAVSTILSNTTGPEKFPVETKLIGNYPNPFNPGTLINFSVKEISGERVQILVFNSLGEKISVLEDSFFAAGNYTTNWNGRDDNGNTIPAGIYFCRLTNGNGFFSHLKLLKLN